MKLSKKGEYALRALIDLATAELVGRRLLRVSEIAQKEKMSVKFLEQVMLQLREAGYVSSERGKFGGYRLARPASQISLGQIVRLIDGPLAPIGCVSVSAYEPCSCPDEAHCGLRMVMLDVRNAIANILDRYTLANVVEVTTRKMRRDGIPLPFTPPEPGHEKPPVRKQGPSLLDEIMGEYTI
jgi:Rrf2 family protein